MKKLAFLLIVSILFMFFASAQGIEIIGDNIDGVINLEEEDTSGGDSGSNVSSVDSGDNCIFVNPTTGDVIITFNDSCGGGGTPFDNTNVAYLNNTQTFTENNTFSSGDLFLGSGSIDQSSIRFITSDLSEKLLYYTTTVNSFVFDDTLAVIGNIEGSQNITATDWLKGKLNWSDVQNAPSFEDTQKNTTGFYLYNDSTTIFFNETQLNNTIDLRSGGNPFDQSLNTTDSVTFVNLTAGNICYSDGTNCTSTGGDSPWAFDSDQIWNATSFVGIGTTNPQHELDVQGHIETTTINSTLNAAVGLDLYVDGDIEIGQGDLIFPDISAFGDVSSRIFNVEDLFFQTGLNSTISAGEDANDTLNIRAFDTDGTGFIDMIKIISGAIVKMDLFANTTIDGKDVCLDDGTNCPASGNPFDQSLNTTDDVLFGNLNTTNDINVGRDLQVDGDVTVGENLYGYVFQESASFRLSSWTGSEIFGSAGGSATMANDFGFVAPCNGSLIAMGAAYDVSSMSGSTNGRFQVKKHDGVSTTSMAVLGTAISGAGATWSSFSRQDKGTDTFDEGDMLIISITHTGGATISGSGLGTVQFSCDAY